MIAIDGPAGSGKSTVARRVAERLGFDYLDTGAMYRSVAFAALERGVDVGDVDAVAALAHDLEIVVAGTVTVDGEDATAAIRSSEVTRAVSAVAAIPAVRREMVWRQRAWLEGRDGGVVEGRDIGTVVFPDADLKVFLTASDEERAKRRAGETAVDDIGAVAADIARRDTLDSTRVASPLAMADDALVIDTTGLDVDAVVEKVLSKL